MYKLIVRGPLAGGALKIPVGLAVMLAIGAPVLHRPRPVCDRNSQGARYRYWY